MEFKIGNRVKIIDHYCEKFCGLTGTVHNIYGSYSENIYSNSLIIEVRLDEMATMRSNGGIHYAICNESNIVKLSPHNDDISVPEIKNVYFNDPLTIVIWKDGSKTFVKNADGDDCYDPEKALAMAISKKALGNKYNYYKEFEKWLPEIDEKPSMEELVSEMNGKVILWILEGRSIGYMSEQLHLKPHEIEANIDELMYILRKHVGKRRFFKTLFVK